MKAVKTKWRMRVRPVDVILLGIGILSAFVVVQGFTPSKSRALTECRLAALKSFGHLRTGQSRSFPYRSELENQYIELCMDRRAFILDYQLIDKQPANLRGVLASAGTFERDKWLSDVN